MSTAYRFTREFTKTEVLHAMTKAGLDISDAPESSDTQFCITDGKVYLWAYCEDDGSNVNFCRYGGNYEAEDLILAPLADELQTDYLSEHDEIFFEDEDYKDEEE